MTLNSDALKNDHLHKVIQQARTRLSGEKARTAEAFIAKYYADVPVDDIVEVDPENLYGAALSLLQWAGTRTPGDAKIRVYNPHVEEHGWHSRHTVIEIVNDDMPFLVDSVTMELNRQNLTVHLIVHPVVSCERDPKGVLIRFEPGKVAGDGLHPESWMQVLVDEQTAPDVLKAIGDGLRAILRDVRVGVEDWRTMLGRVEGVLEGLQSDPPSDISRAETEEAVAFLQWVHDDHFTFLGYREVRIAGRGRKTITEVVEGSGLGVLREPDVEVFEGMRHRGELPPVVRAFIREPHLLLIAKANLRSTVHRPVHLDSIAVKILDAKGDVVGEHIFVGLFTSVAYSVSPRRIPFLRRKVDAVMEGSGFNPGSHIGKALMHVLESFPRDELFQIGVEDLLQIATGIVQLQERQRIALFVRRDNFERFVSAFVYLPRDRYNRQLRESFGAILAAAFNGHISAYYTHFGDEVLGRIHYIVGTEPGAIPDYDLREIEARLKEAGRSWSDRLHEALIEAQGEERGNALFRSYGDAFPTAYVENFHVQLAVHDVERMEEAVAGDRLGMNLFHPIEAAENELRFKIYNRGEMVPLSDALPLLENMGLKVLSEQPFEVTPEGSGGPIHIHDFHLVTADGAGVDFSQVRAAFHASFERVWNGEMESDGFNRLVLRAGLEWREVTVLRAFSKYLRQAAIPFSQDYMEEVLSRNSAIASLIVRLFRTRFDPDHKGDREAEEHKLRETVDELLDQVSNLDEDRILRRFLNLVTAMLRTNYYQPGEDGGPKPYISFKFDARSIDELPLPRPLREIFVYSPRMEGIHLRFGLVARGGIRWSDRREDFRTEILGLVKAQQVKNSVIVPVGSKGGFVLKKAPPPSDRDAFLAEGVACYRMLMWGLLDITDNLSGEEVVPPHRVVRKDGNDPYLVVAADKGTATFSDFANAVARDYGFWLDDAFASGGSAGYDHKKMGITARGAWESVKRHFRELGHDTQSQDFTVLGVGDMSGDVFGNGMLLSRHIRLIGAFNHLHIFIDPDPDPAASFAERQRLFDLGRGSWDGYDPKLISKGGGVFDRRAKSIALTPEIKALFGIDRDSVAPSELMHAMLKAPVDLLWFGGIGTYVKASDESHGEVGDRANDGLRVDAEALRCRVVGEGANLGFTQRGRIEFAQEGGKINTDSIDNSAGVDCSDHEVNIKIALGDVVQRGDMTLKQRNDLLVSMTDEVARLVLRDNYQQTLALSVKEAQGPAHLHNQQHFMRGLERQGLLNRSIEFLPNDEEIAERQALNRGLTRPELAVLLAYSKIVCYDEILASDLPDDPLLRGDLMRYFPEPLQEKFPDTLARHRLRREIVATVVTNSMVNRVGESFVHDMKEATGFATPDIARAYIIARDSFQVRDTWYAVEALDNKVEAAVQTEMLLDSYGLIQHAVLWFLRNGSFPMDITDYVETYGKGIAALEATLDQTVSDAERDAIRVRAEELDARGVPAELAGRIARMPTLGAACDIVRIAVANGRAVADVAEIYFDVGERFGVEWLRSRAQEVEPRSSWHRRALEAIVDDLYGHQSAMTTRVLANGGADRGAGETAAANTALIEAWVCGRGVACDRVDELVTEMRSAGTVDLSMLAVANREFRNLVG